MQNVLLIDGHVQYFLSFLSFCFREFREASPCASCHTFYCELIVVRPSHLRFEVITTTSNA
jgi:hypothetical protein